MTRSGPPGSEKGERWVPEHPCLVVKGGPTDGTVFNLTMGAVVTVGSGSLAHLQIPVEGVSSAHLKIQWDDSGIFATDNGSFTGTFVNGLPIVTGPLWDNDRIAFGPTGKDPTLPKLLVRIPPGSVVVVTPPALQEASADRRAAAALDDAPAEGGAPPAAPAPPRASSTARSPARPSVFDDLAGLEARLRAAQRPARTFAGRPVLVAALAGVALLALAAAGWVFLRRPPPAITSVTPPSVSAGETLTIVGTGFAAAPSDNVVRFGDVTVPVMGADGGRLTVRAPVVPDTAVQQVLVAVETGGRRSAPVKVFLKRPPVAAALDPEGARPGDEVTLRGQFLSEDAAVTVGGAPARVVDARSSTLRFVVPDLPQGDGSLAPVVVRTTQGASRPVDLVIGRLPVLMGASPERAAMGERVTLRGRGFSAERVDDAVTFGGRPALVLAASARELQVLVPPSAPEAGPQWLVTVDGRPSSGTAAFTPLAESGAYVLRFAAVPGAAPGEAWITTSFAPVLLLASADGGASTAQRAADLAAALDALAQERQQNPDLVVEARGDPAPGVAKAGSAALIVRATAEDATACERASGGRSGSIAPSALAAHWTALIGDYLDLFVGQRRPVRMLGASPAGRALTDLAAEVGWRPGRVIGASALASIGSPLVERLRAMALAPARPGTSSFAAVLEGTWEGEIEEPDAGLRPITVRFSLAGGRIGGTLSRSTGVTGQVPVRDISFQDGRVTFTADLGREPRRFVAPLRGDVLEGEVAVPGGSAGGGHFRLRYVL